MNVIYLHQYFKIDLGGTRSYEFSRYLIKKGHTVTMITGNELQKKQINGINVKSTKTPYSNNYSFIKRILAFIHFMIKSTIIGLREKNMDVIYATSTPLTIGVPALIISKIKRKPFIFEVRDVWPDVPIELGYIKNPLLKKVLLRFERIIYNQASHIVVLSKGMKENLLNKGIPESKLTVITNLSMNKYFNLNKIEPRKEHENELLCIHPGTMGVVNGLDFVLDVAKKFPNENIKYLLIGEGNKKLNLQKRIKDENIKNVLIRDAVPKSEVLKMTAQSDVGLMIVNDYPILKDNSANKFFDFLAAGLPVVTNYSGWKKEVLENHKAGKTFEYDEKEGFYNFLLSLSNNKSLLESYSNNAKLLAKTYYDSDKLAGEFEEILLKVVNK